MLDIKVIRERLDWAKEKLATRGIKPEELDEVVAIDEKRRAKKKKADPSHYWDESDHGSRYHPSSV